MNAYLCKRCAAQTLYITDDEMSLLVELKEKGTVTKQKTIEKLLYNYQNYKSQFDITNPYPEKTKLKLYQDSITTITKEKENFEYELCEKYQNLVSGRVINIKIEYTLDNAGKIDSMFINGCCDAIVQATITKGSTWNNFAYIINDNHEKHCALCGSKNLFNLGLHNIIEPETKYLYHKLMLDNFKTINNYTNPKEIWFSEHLTFTKSVMNEKSNYQYNTSNINVMELLSNLIQIKTNIDLLDEELKSLYTKLSELKSILNTNLNIIRSKNLTFIPKPDIPIKPAEPRIEKISVFSKKADEAHNRNLLQNYELAMQKYNIEQNEYLPKYRAYYQNKINRSNNYHIESQIQQLFNFEAENINWENDFDLNISEEEKSNITLLKQSYTILKDNIDKTKKTLSQLYTIQNDLISLNIIYPKYNNIKAWSFMYELFASGRVDTLEGPHGAYNVYENQVNFDIIHVKLDNIIENQKTIHNDFKKLNQQLEKINDKMDLSLKLSALTAYNTSKIALYTKLNAEITKSLVWLAALKQ